MKIKPMLARLESSMGCENLTQKMLLLPEPVPTNSDKKQEPKSINLIVGYSSSPSSQTALDLTLWIAHQTRFVTQKQVTVQVVYVVDESQKIDSSGLFSLTEESYTLEKCLNLSSVDSVSHEETSIAKPRKTLNKSKIADRSNYKIMNFANDAFAQADRILWQARCLAEEWRGSFKAHLRFGNVAEELRKVVEEESAQLLFLGCNSANHNIIKKLGKNFPCAVLGLPQNISNQPCQTAGVGAKMV